MKRAILFGALFTLLSLQIPVFAHCDGIDGPVVASAKKALESENVNHVLMWVQEKYEDEINEAFERTINVRVQSSEAKQLADMYFFETLVRLHRLGEGATYTGLKPADRDLGPAIPLADEAIESESPTELYKLLTDQVHDGLHHYFEEVLSKKNFDTSNPHKGREFVESYVKFMHYIEGIYEASELTNKHHAAESKNIHKH